MAVKNTHLIIAGDIPALYRLPELAVQKGFPVRVCLNGTEALQASVARPPRLMVIDMNLPLLSASHLIRILRKNPQTAGIDFLLLGGKEQEKEVSPLLREESDSFFLTPHDPERLFAFVLGALSRYGEEFAEMERSVIAGDLRQMSLIDLLQVFSLNRKDGMLILKRGRMKGTIYLLEGNVIDAHTGVVGGRKAFFRLLCWTDGKFSFVRGVPRSEIRIDLPTSHLIMEGLRQKDEMESLKEALPRSDARLALMIPRDLLPKGLRPAIREVILLLESFEKVEDILDHAAVTDLEVLHILKVLLERKMVGYKRDDDALRMVSSPLLADEEASRLRERLDGRDLSLEEGSAKIVVLCSRQEELRLFLETLKDVGEIEFEREMAHPAGEFRPMGELGRIPAGEFFCLRLLHLPAGAEAGPLWQPFCHRLIGVLSLPPYDDKKGAEAFFRGRGIPVRRVGYDLEPGDGVSSLGDGREGWRQLLAGLTAAFLNDNPLVKEEP